MSLEDVEYYRQRAREERALAAASENPEAAKIHAELATHYEALVEHADMLPATRRPAANEDEPDRAA
jgi:hypothetical protein